MSEEQTDKFSFFSLLNRAVRSNDSLKRNKNESGNSDNCAEKGASLDLLGND